MRVTPLLWSLSKKDSSLSRRLSPSTLTSVLLDISVQTHANTHTHTHTYIHYEHSYQQLKTDLLFQADSRHTTNQLDQKEIFKIPTSWKRAIFTFI